MFKLSKLSMFKKIIRFKLCSWFGKMIELITVRNTTYLIKKR